MIALMGMTACQPQVQSANEMQTSSATKEAQPYVFVAHTIQKDEVGNAALFSGVLNEKDGCLYIDDLLVIVHGVYVTWQNQPFWISDSNGKRYSLGDKVSVGGSQHKYPQDETGYNLNALTGKCTAKNVWLAHSIGDLML